MPTSRAMQLCPHLTVVGVRGDAYREESGKIFDIFRDYTDLVQGLSLDEAFLDVTGSDKCHGSATLIAREIRDRIRSERGLTASAGVAPNKFIAKIASDWNKPDGQFVVTPEEVAEFVKQLKVEKIWGVEHGAGDQVMYLSA